MASKKEVEQWSQWLARFLLSKEAADRSPHTLISYNYHLSDYIHWLSEPKQAGIDISLPETIETYLVEQRREGYSPYTVAGRYRSLRVWYNFLVRRVKCMAASPVDDVEAPSLPNDQRPYVKLHEYQKLMDHIEPLTWFDMRDRCMIYLMYWCGLRVSEVLQLSPTDVDASRQQVMVRLGKGKKSRPVPCGHDLGPMILQYLLHRPIADDGLTIKGNPLFVSNNGIGGVRAALTDNGVRQMLRRRCKSAGMQYLKPHMFRHGFAMLFLNEGMELSAVSDVLGHASEAFTSRVYAHWLPESVRREYQDVRRKVAPGR